MKKFICLLVFFFCFCSICFSYQKATFIDDESNIRDEPSAKATLIEVPEKGSTCEILEQRGNWFKVKYNGNKYGWTYKDNISIEKDVGISNNLGKNSSDQFLTSNSENEIKIINSFTLDNSRDNGSTFISVRIKISKLVQSYLTNYFIKHKSILFCDEIFKESKLMFNMASFWDYEYDPMYLSNDSDPRIFYIGDIEVENQNATVNVYCYYDLIEKNNSYWVPIEEASRKEPNLAEFKCALFNGRWFIVDIRNTMEHLKREADEGHMMAFVRNIEKNNQNDKVYLYNKPGYDGKIIGEITESVEIKIEKTKSEDYFRCCDTYEFENLSNNYDLLLIKKPEFDYDNCYIRKSDIMFPSKIKKGITKRVAYMLLGHPNEEKEVTDGEIMFYSQQDYIKCDKNDKIVSWNGFNEFKALFE